MQRMLGQTAKQLTEVNMTQLKGYSVVKKVDGSVIASGLRFNDARRKVEEFLQCGSADYKVEEVWEGVPISIKTHKKKS